jgi:hypothetical protein
MQKKALGVLKRHLRIEYEPYIIGKTYSTYAIFILNHPNNAADEILSSNHLNGIRLTLPVCFDLNF